MILLKEESPIYLIDKKYVENEQPLPLETQLDFLSQDMRQDIESAIGLNSSYQTLRTRAQLSKVSCI